MARFGCRLRRMLLSMTLLSWVGALSHCSYQHQQCSGRPLTQLASWNPSVLRTLPLPLRLKGGALTPTAKRCYLQFEVEAPTLSDDKSVAIVGNHRLIGAWDPMQAILMHKDPSREVDGSETWVLRMDLPAGHKFEYKYVITNDPQRREWYRQTSIPRLNIEVLWETDIPNRILSTVDDGKLHLVHNVFNVASNFNQLEAPEVSILPLTYGTKDGIARRSKSAQLEDAVGEEAMLIALVEEVYKNSPAEDAGLRVGQGVLSIGAINGVHVAEFGMGAVLQEVRDHEGRELRVTVVLEEGRGVEEKVLRPRRWSGEGLLGCKMGACIPDPFDGDADALLPASTTPSSPHRLTPPPPPAPPTSPSRLTPPASSGQWPLYAKRMRESQERTSRAEKEGSALAGSAGGSSSGREGSAWRQAVEEGMARLERMSEERRGRRCGAREARSASGSGSGLSGFMSGWSDGGGGGSEGRGPRAGRGLRKGVAGRSVGEVRALLRRKERGLKPRRICSRVTRAVLKRGQRVLRAAVAVGLEVPAEVVWRGGSAAVEGGEAAAVGVLAGARTAVLGAGEGVVSGERTLRRWAGEAKNASMAVVRGTAGTAALGAREGWREWVAPLVAPAVRATHAGLREGLEAVRVGVVCGVAAGEEGARVGWRGIKAMEFGVRRGREGAGRGVELGRQGAGAVVRGVSWPLVRVLGGLWGRGLGWGVRGILWGAERAGRIPREGARTAVAGGAAALELVWRGAWGTAELGRQGVVAAGARGGEGAGRGLLLVRDGVVGVGFVAGGAIERVWRVVAPGLEKGCWVVEGVGHAGAEGFVGAPIRGLLLLWDEVVQLSLEGAEGGFSSGRRAGEV